MSWLLDPLSQGFMQRAFIAGMLVGGLCACIGVFVVKRGLSFIGDGLAHAAFGGIALGLLFDVETENATWVALPFTVAVSLGIAWVSRSGKLHGDVATGVFFSVSFALGVLLLSMRDPTRPVVSVESLLFGSLLAIGSTDLIVVVATSVVAAIFLGTFWGRLAYATFDPELAKLSGVPVARLDYVLLALTAVVIVISVQTVGVVLVSSFVVLPAATANLVARSLGRATAVAVALGVGGAALGLFASYHLDVPSGATIILGLGAVFFVTLIAKR